MTTAYDILIRPIITEKSSFQSGKLNQYVFEVHADATKKQVKQAVEKVFDVTVERVNIMNMPGKRSRRARSRQLKMRRSGYKKAIITLQPGDSIDVFEGVK